MEKTFLVKKLEDNVLRLDFGAPAQNDQIVKDAIAAVRDLELKGGKLIKLNGPASLPVAVALAHEISHLYATVAVFDPKLGKYVVSVSHSADYSAGDLID
jgi:CRISPR-associated protein Csx3